MATSIGNERDPIRMLCKLIELDHDAIQAYEAAIERLEDVEAQTTLEGFRADHERHTRDLSQCVRDLGETPPSEGDMKAVLTQGKVVFASLIGDLQILEAMKSNEQDTNTAYERAVERADVNAETRRVLEQNLADERRHRDWIDQRIRQLGGH